ncbi:hypothetical protein D9Q98_000138 [Chlorella vulgaris]|uniref:Uncharacterized protein n=1 Tax=Chlorella vulgaris TaxID=3077 RepID=A0A9D4TXK8_CHLVU|nr:hypothetical protein D9Q98_000138 [Chlorella vulgaris]
MQPTLAAFSAPRHWAPRSQSAVALPQPTLDAERRAAIDRRVREQMKKDREAVTAAVKAEHERLMAQMRQEEAARQAAFRTFRTPPPFSPEVAAFIESLNEARDQAHQEVARVAAEKEREQARAAAEQKEKARAAAEEQRQKAEARRAALLEPVPLERKNQ